MEPEQMNEDSPMRRVIRDAIHEFLSAEQTKAEPAYKAELAEERRRREQLERKINELAEENRRSRKMAEEAERNGAIRAELQRLGVSKVDLAHRAVKDDIYRTGDGRLVAQGESGEMALREYLAHFVGENPELLPARIPGGSGTGFVQKSSPAAASGIDLDRIRPGMSAEDLDRVRKEISRIASQSMLVSG